MHKPLFLATVYFNVTDLDRSLMYFFFLPKQYNDAVKHEANKTMWFCTAIVAHSHIISLLTSGHKTYNNTTLLTNTWSGELILMEGLFL